MPSLPTTLPCALPVSRLVECRPEPDTVTITAAPTIPSNAPQYASEDLFTSAILNSTNFFRTEHNASWITWNDTIASFASDYLDNNDDCAFAHSGGPYGENIAMGYPDAASCVDAWGNERKDYNYDSPDFSEETGHFTQLVWKNSTTVGCGKRLCGTRGWYVLCEYWPRGNVIGQFGEEVGRQTNGTGSAGAAVRPSLAAASLSMALLSIAWMC